MRHRTWITVVILGLAAGLQLTGCGDNDNTVILDSCGNGVIDGSEQCDDGNSDDSDDCLSTCRNATCGDSLIEDGVEDCDGNNLAGENCTSLGEGSGTLACDSDCTFDTSGCGSGPNPTVTPVVPTPTATPGTGPTATTTAGGPVPTTTATPPPGNACVAGDQIEATVNVSAQFSGISVVLTYPPSLNIPGKNNDSSVAASVTTKPTGGLSSVSDRDDDADGTDDHFQFSFADPPNIQPAGKFIVVVLNCVPGEQPPSDIPCAVDSASDDLGTTLTGLTCTTALVRKP